MAVLANPHEFLVSLSSQFAEIPTVHAVTLGGSRATAAEDEWSDFDIIVYTTQEIALTQRTAIARSYADHMEIDNRFFEPGDEWVTRNQWSVDIIYRSPLWIEQQLEKVLINHEASLGYTTCFAFNVHASQCYYDPAQWFARLQILTARPYPLALQHAIIALNFPLLRDAQSSYRHQIAVALHREDRISVHHRVTALLASYFDILFAVNYLLHPGEKRLLTYAEHHCSALPDQMAADILALMQAMGNLRQQDLLNHLDHLCDGLERLLTQRHLLG